MRQRGAGACGTVDCCHEREGQTHLWEAPPGGPHRPFGQGVRRPQLTTEHAHSGLSPAGPFSHARIALYPKGIHRPASPKRGSLAPANRPRTGFPYRTEAATPLERRAETSLDDRFCCSSVARVTIALATTESLPLEQPVIPLPRTRSSGGDTLSRHCMARAAPVVCPAPRSQQGVAKRTTAFAAERSCPAPRRARSRRRQSHDATCGVEMVHAIVRVAAATLEADEPTDLRAPSGGTPATFVSAARQRRGYGSRPLRGRPVRCCALSAQSVRHGVSVACWR